MIYQQHVERLKKISHVVDFEAPHEKPFSDKWEKDKRREFLAIEYDNKLMLERLAEAVKEGCIDNKMHKSVSFHREFKARQLVQAKRSRLQQITEENIQMLKRIQEVAPAYNHVEWAEDAKRHNVIKRTMALYPEYYEKKDEEERVHREAEKMRKDLHKMKVSAEATSALLPHVDPSPRMSQRLR
jgi:hypothetical protein